MSKWLWLILGGIFIAFGVGQFFSSSNEVETKSEKKPVVKQRPRPEPRAARPRPADSGLENLPTGSPLSKGMGSRRREDRRQQRPRPPAVPPTQNREYIQPPRPDQFPPGQPPGFSPPGRNSAQPRTGVANKAGNLKNNPGSQPFPDFEEVEDFDGQTPPPPPPGGFQEDSFQDQPPIEQIPDERFEEIPPPEPLELQPEDFEEDEGL